MLIEIKSFAFLQTNQREIYKEEKSCIKKNIQSLIIYVDRNKKFCISSNESTRNI